MMRARFADTFFVLMLLLGSAVLLSQMVTCARSQEVEVETKPALVPVNPTPVLVVWIPTAVVKIDDYPLRFISSYSNAVYEDRDACERVKLRETAVLRNRAASKGYTATAECQPRPVRRAK